MIIPIAIGGAALVAFLIVGLIYRRKRKQRQAKKDNGLLDSTMDEETPSEMMAKTPNRPGDSSTAATVGHSYRHRNCRWRRALITTKKATSSNVHSSFVSESSAATSNYSGGANAGSVLSGLTRILGGGSLSTPLDNAAVPPSYSYQAVG